MASAPPSSLSPSVFRSSTPSGCPHEKMPAEAPIELGEARPTVASREGGEQHLESDLYKSDELSCSRGATSEGKGSMSLRPGSERLKHRLLEATFSAPPAGSTAAACVTEENSAAVGGAIYGMRAPTFPCPCLSLSCSGACRPAPRHPTIKDNTSPRKIPPSPQVLSRAAACTRRESRTQRRQHGCAQ